MFKARMISYALLQDTFTLTFQQSTQKVEHQTK